MTLVLIIIAILPALPALSQDEGPFDMARELYEAGDYIGSVETLEAIEPRTDEVIYWLWKNEREIGRLADPSARDAESPQYTYYLYAQNHPEYLSYDEVRGGTYTLTRRRYEELKARFPRSEYTGTVLFELIEHDHVTLSGDGLDEGSRLALISAYQEFLNRYPQHPHATRAKQEIGALEKWEVKLEKKEEGKPGGGSMLLPYEARFNIDRMVFKLYVNEWLKSGWYREYPVKVIVGTERLDGFNIPESTKKGIQNLLEGGNLIVISEAAFQGIGWQGPKFLVFEPRAK